jgi:hypothetical protein
MGPVVPTGDMRDGSSVVAGVRLRNHDDMNAQVCGGLGAGQRVFEDINPDAVKLDLSDAAASRSGSVILTYTYATQHPFDRCCRLIRRSDHE